MTCLGLHKYHGLMKKEIYVEKNWLTMCIEMCVASLGLFAVCVRLPSSPVWVLICRPPVAEEHFTELHQRENRRTEWENQVGEASKADSLQCFHMLQHPSGNS